MIQAGMEAGKMTSSSLSRFTFLYCCLQGAWEGMEYKRVDAKCEIKASLGGNHGAG